MHWSAGDHAEAGRLWKETLAIRQKLAGIDPENLVLKNELAAAHNNLGAVSNAANRLAEAQASWQEALTIRQELARRDPVDDQIQLDLSSTWNNLGVLHYNADRFPQAEQAWNQALQLRKWLVRRQPASTRYQLELGSTYNALAALYTLTNRSREAETTYTRALEDYAELQQFGLPSLELTYEVLYEAYVHRAYSLDALSRHREALADWEQALALNGSHRVFLMFKQAADHAWLGQRDRAIQRTTDALAIRPTEAWMYYYQAALVHTILARVAAADSKRSGEHADEAMRLLRRPDTTAHVRQGRLLEEIRSQRDWGPVREHRDFAGWVKSLEKPASP